MLRSLPGGQPCGSTASVSAMLSRALRPSACLRWQGSGRCCAVGGARIGALHKKNSRSTAGFSSSFTTCESEAKRCWVRSLHCSSAKTPESNKSALAPCGVWSVEAQRLQYPCLSAMVLPLWHTRDRLHTCIAFFFEEWHVSQREAWSEVLRCKWSSSETNLS